ncbi:hypothetical protein BU14_0348s0013 [Porphyra umbilicalis]|uniref:Uncharacterized protein n=1 Tax=Porphyra umbilicalis TaxID=2786 RepID=A0A1X6NY60_PORUM|nr:hypothetical protein BU14_0348s0013 [Porphyra umbilicalis]|eukprot:OSX73436.1 hypothetical protein BU14_0348s0013 [Porphyra umbilicalis]
MHCGGVAVAPTAPLSALPVRLQTQFIIDNNVSAALFHKLRLLLGPAACLASREPLRADRALAETEEPHFAGTNGGGAYLFSPRAALQATFDHALSKKQFLERLVRGEDGREIQATTSFSGQDSPAALPPPGVSDVVVLRGPPRRQGATAGTTATAGDVGPRRVGATPAAVVADGLATRYGGARGRPRCPARAP